MPLKIINVLKNSPAERGGIRRGDRIISINGNAVDDFIGLQFYSSDQYLEFIIESEAGEEKKILLTQDWQGKLGIEPEPHQIKKCCNECIFCFIDQMPPDMRSSLYLKDDDYLFSFVYGNYISLNNLSEQDFRRIVRERISPLYVSVHTTNPVLRKKIMRYRRDQDIMERLDFLSKHGISFHTQIVVMPGLNDREELERTIRDLTQPKINTLSIGIVPVGLTKYREDLYPLKPVTRRDAIEVITSCGELAKITGFDQIYCADELFILAEREIPDEKYYDDFCQLENGIGMVRAMTDNFRRQRESFLDFLQNSSILFVTGVIAREYLEEICRDINERIQAKKAELKPVINRFFGERVTVSGLLTFGDIETELEKSTELPEIIAFSSNMFNTDGYTLDGVHQSEIKERLRRKILVIDELWTDWSYI